MPQGKARFNVEIGWVRMRMVGIVGERLERIAHESAALYHRIDRMRHRPYTVA
jgi:hypothetical protein